MKLKKWLIDYIPMGLTAILIIYFAVIHEQSFLKTLPTLITLVVQLLLVAANRYSFLLGGLNCALYGIAYFTEGLYFSTIFSVLVSMPLQIFSFFNWKKHKQKGVSAELQFLSWKQRILTTLVTLVCWVACYFLMTPLFKTANVPSLDALCFVIGVVVSILSAFRYIDSQSINLINCGVQVFIWTLLTIKNPGNFNYVIISCYNLFRIVEAAVMWTRQYNQTQKEKESTAQ